MPPETKLAEISVPGGRSRPLGIDDDQPLKGGDVAEPMVGTDEPVDGDRLVEVKGDAKLEGIQGANLPAKAMVRDEIPRTVVVKVEQSEDLIPPA